MRNKTLKLLLISLAAAIVFSACGGAKESAGKAGNGGEFTIVTSFYPIYISVLNVARDIPGVEVINMTQPQTGCLHDYQLAPSDMKTLEYADAFVVNGAGMEAFLDKVVEQMPELKVIEASDSIELLPGEGVDGKNPHVWVSISNAITQVKNIGEKLGKVDPRHEDMYKKNAEAYITKLQEQRDKMHKSLDGLKNRDIVTLHEAFPYFAKEFNLNVVAVIEREPGSEPSAGELADIIDKINKTGVKALFAEPQYSQRAVESIAKQTGAKVYSLDPVVTGENNTDYDAYIKAMDANMKVLVEALDGQ